MRHLLRLAPILVVLASLAGCGSTAGTVTTEGPRASGPPPYDGALYVEVDEPDDPDVVTRSGAAGRTLECDGKPGNGSTADNYGINADGDDSAVGALTTFLREDAYGLPTEGYRLEQSDGERELMSFDVAGRTRVAVVLHLEGRQWQVETFAHCDPAEFPDEVELPFDVWTDKAGRRVSTALVRSGPGPEHCGWESATFVTLEQTPGYVSDPEGVLDDVGRGYEPDTALPDDAEDTGYRLDGTALWLAGDSAAAYLVTGRKTERLPTLPQPFGCA